MKYYFSYIVIKYDINKEHGWYRRSTKDCITYYDIKDLLKKTNIDKRKTGYTLEIYNLGYMTNEEFGWDDISNVLDSKTYFSKYRIR